MEGRGSAAGRLAVVATTTVLVLAMVSGALAANHLVGGAAQQWNYPPENNVNYYDTTWAANQTFAVGDTLQFEYAAGAHNVVRYNTSAEFIACAGAVVKEWTTGNDSIPLTTAGTYYFICSVPGHCTSGMKLSVKVAGGVVAPAPSPTAPAPAPTPMTPAPAPTTPAPAPTTPAPAPTTPAPAPTTPAPTPTTAPTTAPAPTTTSPPPPSPPPPSAASSGPVLSMAGLVTAALVAILAFLV